jgi:hypothetical protein
MELSLEYQIREPKIVLNKNPLLLLLHGYGSNEADLFSFANELPEEYFAKLNIELVASNYSWAKSYNNDLEVKSDYKFETIDTKKTLETIVLKFVDRVKKGLTAEEFNNPNISMSEKISKIEIIEYHHEKDDYFENIRLDDIDPISNLIFLKKLVITGCKLSNKNSLDCIKNLHNLIYHFHFYQAV